MSAKKYTPFLLIILSLGALAFLGWRLSASPVIAAEPENTAAADPAHNAQNALDWAGSYYGLLPCADCEGIEESVTLRPDGSFTLLTRYKSKDQQIMTEHGQFSWDADKTRITLPLQSQTVQYKVIENGLQRLDIEGNPIEGTLAENYKLQKKPEPSIQETYWKLTQLMDKPVEGLQRDAYIILKKDDARVIGSSGCNRLMGAYELDAEKSRLSFSQTAGTMMACMEGMDIERMFLDTLAKTDSYAISDGKLMLHSARMAPLAVFEPVYLY